MDFFIFFFFFPHWKRHQTSTMQVEDGEDGASAGRGEGGAVPYVTVREAYEIIEVVMIINWCVVLRVQCTLDSTSFFALRLF